MRFQFKKFLDHGTANPIVARLGLQVPEILEQCEVSQELRDKVVDVYLNSMLRKLVRCGEIEHRFREEFNAAASAFKPPSVKGQPIEIPQIGRLEEECHNFLYEAKNYIRDLLQVVNLLYGTNFKEASEFFAQGKKRGLSLVAWASKTFGSEDPKTKFLLEAVSPVQRLIYSRNAVEHPNGYSGILRITNFRFEADAKLCEPTWCREMNGDVVEGPSSIRMNLDAIVQNLLVLGESVLVSWAEHHLIAPAFMRLATIPPEQRDPNCPVKYVVMPSLELEKGLSHAAKDKKG